MSTMTLLERMKYNKLPIPSIDEIAKSELYNSMIKFNISDVERKLTFPSAWLYMPETAVVQYLGNKKYETIEKQGDIDGFMFWHSSRGLITQMILIPESNYKLLLNIGDPAKEFIEYFEDKDFVKLIINNAMRKIDGISSKYRHVNTKMRFSADNTFYIRMEKILYLKR